MNKKKVLGKGLSSLLSNKTAQKIINKYENLNEIKHINILLIEKNQFQPREDFNEDSLKTLADSIKSQGLIQPIIVRKISDQKYQLIAGERRLKASQMLNLTTIPAIVKKTEDKGSALMAIIENIQREDLNVIEKAKSLKQIQNQFNLTQEELSQTLGIARTSISNLTRLLNLSLNIQQMLITQQIEFGHAKVLLSLKDENKQLFIANEIINKKLTVIQTENLIKQKPKKNKKIDININHFEKWLSEKLDSKVSIKDKNGKGKLIINYSSLDNLKYIIEKIKISK